MNGAGSIESVGEGNEVAVARGPGFWKTQAKARLSRATGNRVQAHRKLGVQSIARFRAEKSRPPSRAFASFLTCPGDVVNAELPIIKFHSPGGNRILEILSRATLQVRVAFRRFPHPKRSGVARVSVFQEFETMNRRTST